jgi:hypothetical protein
MARMDLRFCAPLGPVKSTAWFLARAREWWTTDCEMCHNENLDGEGETAKGMTLTMVDFTNPRRQRPHRRADRLAQQNGHNDKHAEGPRITTEQGWDLKLHPVNRQEGR